MGIFDDIVQADAAPDAALAPSPPPPTPPAQADAQLSRGGGMFDDIVGAANGEATTPTLEGGAVQENSPGSLFADITGDAPASTSAPYTWNPIENIKAGAQRGTSQLGESWHVAIPVLKYQLGLGDADEVATAAAPIREGQRRQAQKLPPVATSMGDPAWWEQNLGALIPGAAATVAGGVVGMGAGAAIGSAVPIAGTAAGGAIGALAGLGSVGALQTNATAFLDYLESKGVDTTKPAAISAALALDKNLGEEASWYAAKRSGVNALVNMIAGKAGAKIADLGLSVGKKIGAEAAVGAGSMGAGETANQALTEEHFDPGKIVQSTVLGAASGFPAVAIGGVKLAARPIRRGVVRMLHGEDEPPPPPNFIIDANGNVRDGPNFPFINDRENMAAGTALHAINALQREIVTTEGGLSHAGANAAWWRQKLIPKLSADFWENTDTGRRLMESLSELSGNTLLRAEHVNELVLASRVRVDEMVNEVGATSTPNLQPRLRITNYSAEHPHVDVEISAGQQAGGAKTALIVDRISRAMTPSEWMALTRYAHERGFDKIAWNKDLGNTAFPTGKRGVMEDAFVKRFGGAAVHVLDSVNAKQEHAPGDWWQSVSQREGPPVEPVEVRSARSRLKAGNQAKAIIADLDAKGGAKDIEYRKVFSTGAKTALKRGETWRSKAIAYAKSLDDEIARATETVRKWEENRADGDVPSSRWIGKATPNLRESGKYSPDQIDAIQNTLVKVINTIAKGLHLSKPLRVKFFDDPNESMLGSAGGYADVYELNIHTLSHQSVAHMYEVMGHELGHIIVFDKVRTAPPKTLIAILDAYHRWRDEVATVANKPESDVFQIGKTRSAAMEWLARRGVLPSWQSSLFPDSNAGHEYNTYWHSYEEFFAQQVAKWSTSSLKPLSVVEKFFYRLGQTIFRTISRLYRNAGVQFKPDKLIAEYLDTLLQDVDPGAFASVYQKIAIRSMVENQAALNDLGAGAVEAIPTTPSTEYGRGVLLKLFSGQNRPGWRRSENNKGVVRTWEGLAGISDIINRFIETTFGIHQLTLTNMHIRPLVRYKETMQLAEQEKISTFGINRGVKLIKKVKRTLRTAEQIGDFNRAAFDYESMSYLSAAELDKGEFRLPTPDEMDTIMEKLSPEGKELFRQMIKDYDDQLENFANVLRDEANKSTNLGDVAIRLQNIDADMARMRERPYLPHLRFGKYTVTIVDNEGKTHYFATTENKRDRAALAAKLRVDFPEPLFFVRESILAEDAIPLIGIPPNMLRLIHEKLRLSETQKRAVQDLQYQLAPSQSFRHRFQKRENIPGYSKDFIRAYADYFIHSANFLARAKYRDKLQAQIDEIREQQDFMPDGTKRQAIGNMMAQHFGTWLDPKPDHWRLKAVAFFVHLGYNVKAAAVNLTQLPIATYPFLSRGFGDLRTMKEMMSAMTELQTYYTRAKLEGRSGSVMTMLDELVKEGVITEALAPELASWAENRNMVNRYLGNTAQRAFAGFMHGSAFMFSMTEQMNRRVTAVAAFKLALADPTNALVIEAVKSNPEQFARLIEKGIHPDQARAITVAKYAVEGTQGIYARWARPKMFQGKKGALFMFKSFQQQTLFMLWNYPTAAVKSFLVMGALGGLAGEPLAQDMFDLIKVLAYQLFGSDFDVEREARNLIIDMADGTIPPDLLLHGTSRYGFGIPALLDLVGNTTGLGDIPFPVTDISSSVGFGPTNPVPLAPLFGPVKDVDAAIGTAAQHASGAAYSLGFALFKVLTDPVNSHAWSLLVPRALYNISRAYDAMNDNVTNASGARIVKFDTNDTEQMMEALALGLGAPPSRLTGQWDRIRAIKEVEMYWNLRREALLRQYTSAVLSKDAEDKARAINAIRQWNRTLPDEVKLKRIDGDSLRSSLRARQKSVSAQEGSRAINRSDLGLVRSVNKLYPEASDVVASRKVPKTLSP